MRQEIPALVSTQWLEDHLSAPDIRIIDASWHMPASGRDARSEFETMHIPGATFFDIDEICDSDNPLPHMLPSSEKMSSRMRQLGLGDGNRIIVYDSSNVCSSARVWWMLKIFGHHDVAVLDGGLRKWTMEERPVEDLPAKTRERHFTARVDTTLIRNCEQIKQNLDTQKEQIVDARSPARFPGQEQDPRPGIRSGHIPNALNVPFSKLLNESDYTFKSPDEIRTIFEKAGVDLNKPITTSCGSGITAAVLTLGLYMVGHRHVALYDGSWSEWGAKEDCPVATE